MAAVITNPAFVGEVSGRHPTFRVRTDRLLANWWWKNRNRLNPPWGLSAGVTVGTNTWTDWSYEYTGYEHPTPDKIGGASRPDVGQLTP